MVGDPQLQDHIPKGLRHDEVALCTSFDIEELVTHRVHLVEISPIHCIEGSFSHLQMDLLPCPRSSPHVCSFASHAKACHFDLGSVVWTCWNACWNAWVPWKDVKALDALSPFLLRHIDAFTTLELVLILSAHKRLEYDTRQREGNHENSWQSLSIIS